MKRIWFLRKPAHGGTTHQSNTDRGPGWRQFWVKPTIPACFFAGLFLFGCETQPPSKPVGSGCQYRDIPGTCRIEKITPSGPNTYGEGLRTMFSFLPDSDREESRGGMRMIIGDGQDPTKKYLAENRIEAGRRFRCTRKLRIRGPCSPEVFLFPDFKNVY